MGNVSTAQNRQSRPRPDAAHLQIRLLGPLTITKNGGSVAVPSKKARALLGYLALREGTEVSRSVLTGLLWGERSEGAARASLRQTLSELRSALGVSAQHAMISNRETITWVSGSASIDAKQLEIAAGSKDEAAIRDAAELIHGELMEGLSVNEPSFEQWLAGERERFRLIACSIYERLSQAAERDARLEEALNFGLRLLALDPLQEHVHRTLMRLYAAQGRHDAALAQFERCRRELSAQLAAAPQPETEQLARAIRVGRRRDGAAKSQISSPAAVEPEGGNTFARPDRPSIAVLPFTNLSSDSEQRYFSDGITEDIITELSRYHSLLVIARNSSFQFRSPSADAADVRQALGVRYIVEGSVRKAGNRIRVTVQLIDAVTRAHIWAERYEPIANDIFLVQDEIALAVASTLESRVAASGAEHARRKTPNDWAAYDYFLQGREQYHRYKVAEAEPLFARAIELDPGYAQAYAFRAHALLAIYCYDPKTETLKEALDCAAKALSLDDSDPWCQIAMGCALMFSGQRKLASPYFDRAIALNPADVQVAYWHAWSLVRLNRVDEGLANLDVAIKRDPFPPAWFWELRGIALLVARRYEDAIQSLTRMSHLHVWDHAYLAACHAYLNRPIEAHAETSEVLRIDPRFTVHRYAKVEGYTLPSQLRHLLEGLRKAGLPE